jgi:hypothetical protein
MMIQFAHISAAGGLSYGVTTAEGVGGRLNIRSSHLAGGGDINI